MSRNGFAHTCHAEPIKFVLMTRILTLWHCTAPYHEGLRCVPKRYNDYVRPLGKLLCVLQLLYHCYADDTQAAESFEPKIEHNQVAAVKELEDGINKITQCMRSNRLKIME